MWAGRAELWICEDAIVFRREGKNPGLLKGDSGEDREPGLLCLEGAEWVLDPCV